MGDGAGEGRGGSQRSLLLSQQLHGSQGARRPRPAPSQAQPHTQAALSPVQVWSIRLRPTERPAPPALGTLTGRRPPRALCCHILRPVSHGNSG